MHPYAVAVKYGGNVLQCATHIRRAGLALRNATSLKYSGQHSLTSTAMCSINFGTAFKTGHIALFARFYAAGGVRISGEQAQSLASVAYTSTAPSTWTDWQEVFGACVSSANHAIGVAKLWGRSPAGGALRYELRCLRVARENDPAGTTPAW